MWGRGGFTRSVQWWEKKGTTQNSGDANSNRGLKPVWKVQKRRRDTGLGRHQTGGLKIDFRVFSQGSFKQS